MTTHIWGPECNSDYKGILANDAYETQESGVPRLCRWLRLNLFIEWLLRYFWDALSLSLCQ